VIHFTQDENGNILPFAAFALPVLLAIGSFTVDLSSAYVIEGRLQNAADAGALAAVLDIDKAAAAVKASAVNTAQQNAKAGDGTIVTTNDVALGFYDSAAKTFTDAGTPVNAVRVRTSRTTARGNELRTILAGFIGQSYFDLTAEAIALFTPPPRCVFALNGTASHAFQTNGSGSVNVANCGIQVNSTSSNAMVASGASSIVAKENCVAGGYSGSVTATPVNCQLKADPLSSVPEPTPPSTCYMNGATISTNRTLPAGVRYCGTIKVEGGAHVTLENGIYYFVGAKFQFSGSSRITANNAMIYLDAASSMNYSSSGQVDLYPPTTGTYRGISIFGSRATQSPAQSVKLGGGVGLNLYGSLYTPKHEVTLRGNSNLTVGTSGYVIADMFGFTGDSSLTIAMSSSYAPAGLSSGGKLVK